MIMIIKILDFYKSEAYNLFVRAVVREETQLYDRLDYCACSGISSARSCREEDKGP